jgi:hypothetical protein
VLLSPDNTEIIGGSVDHLEFEQPTQFTASLTARLEAAEIHLNAPKTTRGRKATVKPAKASAAKTTVARSNPLTTPQSRLTLKPSMSGSTARAQTDAMAGTYRPSRATENSHEAARKARAEAIMQLKQDSSSSRAGRNAKRPIQSEDEYDIEEADDSFIRGVEEAEANAVTRSRYFSQAVPESTASAHTLQDHSKYRVYDSDDSRNGGGAGAQRYDDDDDGVNDHNEDEYDFDDDSFIREIDEQEMIASATLRASSAIGHRTMASSGASTARGSKASRSSRSQPVEIIEISD